MDDGLKQRLVGALVLVALAVIFLPSLFQRDTRIPIDTTSLIPVAPVVEPVTIDIAQKPEGFDPAPQPGQAYQPPVAVVESPSVVEPNTTDKQEVASNIAPLKPQSIAEPTPTAKPKVVKKALKPGLDSKGIPRAWVVQVASFKASARAKAFNDKLLAKGYRAYIRTLNTQKGTVSRVFVGPVVDQKQATALKKKLDKAYSLNALVLKFTAK